MPRGKTKQPEGLIEVLLRKDAEFGDRDDAASDLWEFDEPEAEEALLTVAADPATDPMLAESCAESLGEIWVRRETLNLENVRRLRGEPLRLAVRRVEGGRPEWKELTDAIHAQ